MIRAFGAAVFVLLVAATPSPAQFFPIYPPRYPYYIQGFGYFYPGRYPGWCGPVPPWYAPPGYGVVVISRPIVVVQGGPPRIETSPPRPGPDPEDNPNLRVIKPLPGGLREWEQRQARRPEVIPAGRPAAPIPDPPPLLEPAPDPDAKIESARQVDRGKIAFAFGEYGRALERFQRAIAVSPGNAEAYFLLAQAEFAMGKFREAVATIHAGLRRRPDAPVDFHPRQLYTENAADFPTQLDVLRQALERHPDDVALRFLYAYQLWCDGRRVEARPLFEAIRPRVMDPTAVDRFLDRAKGA
jgi:hypothetical protein